METRVMSTAKKLESLDVSSQTMDDLQEIDHSKTFTKEFSKRYQEDE